MYHASGPRNDVICQEAGHSNLTRCVKPDQPTQVFGKGLRRAQRDQEAQPGSKQHHPLRRGEALDLAISSARSIRCVACLAPLVSHLRPCATSQCVSVTQRRMRRPRRAPRVDSTLCTPPCVKVFCKTGRGASRGKRHSKNSAFTCDLLSPWLLARRRAPNVFLYHLTTSHPRFQTLPAAGS